MGVGRGRHGVGAVMINGHDGLQKGGETCRLSGLFIYHHFSKTSDESCVDPMGEQHVFFSIVDFV